MRDESGNPAGFRGIARDVTKRKEMEKELERRFQYLEAVLTSGPPMPSLPWTVTTMS